MQLGLDNAGGELLPGGYASVRLRSQRDAVPLHIPVQRADLQQGRPAGRNRRPRRQGPVQDRDDRPRPRHAKSRSPPASRPTTASSSPPPDGLADGDKVRVVRRRRASPPRRRRSRTGRWRRFPHSPAPGLDAAHHDLLTAPDDAARGHFLGHRLYQCDPRSCSIGQALRRDERHGLAHPPLQHAVFRRRRRYRPMPTGVRSIFMQMLKRRGVTGGDARQRPCVGLGAHHHHAVLDLALALVDHGESLDLALARGLR